MIIPLYTIDTDKSIRDRVACSLNCLPEQLLNYNSDKIDVSKREYKLTSESSYPIELVKSPGDSIYEKLNYCIGNFTEYKTPKERVFEFIYYSKNLYNIKEEALLLGGDSGGSKLDNFEELLFQSLLVSLGYTDGIELIFNQMYSDFYEYYKTLSDIINSFNTNTYNRDTYVKEIESIEEKKISDTDFLVSEITLQMDFRVDYSITELFDRFEMSDKYPIIKLNGVHKVDRRVNYSEKLKNIKYRNRIRPINTSDYDSNDVIYIWQIEKISDGGKLYKYNVVKLEQKSPFTYTITTTNSINEVSYENSKSEESVKRIINSVLTRIDLKPNDYQKLYSVGRYELYDISYTPISYKMNMKLLGVFFINEVMTDLLFTTPSFRYFLNVNDNTIADKKKNEPNKFNIIVDNDDYNEKLVISKYKIRYSHQIPKYEVGGEYIRIPRYDINTNYIKISINIKRSDISQLKFLNWIILKLFSYYAQKEMVGGIETVKKVDELQHSEIIKYAKEMTTDREVTASDIKEIFPEGYSRSCIRSRKPLIIQDTKLRRQHILNILKLRNTKIRDESKIDFSPFEMLFPKERITMKDGRVIEPMYYVAKLSQTKYIYPGLVKIDNSPIGLQYAPCTFQTPKVGVSGSRYDFYTRGKKEGGVIYKLNSVSKSTNVITNTFPRAKFGPVPVFLQKLSLHKKGRQIYKSGVPFSRNSALWCLEYATGNLPETEDDIIEVKKTKIIPAISRTAVAQQTSITGYTPLEEESFVDPKIWIRVLEEVYKVNIHFLSDYMNPLGMLELPVHKNTYYKSFKYKRHVILFRHESTDNIEKTIKPKRKTYLEFEQYELVGELNGNTKYGISSLFSTDENDRGREEKDGIVYDPKLIENIMDAYGFFYNDKIVIYEPIHLKACRPTAQYIDTSGNCRGLFVLIDKSEVFFYFLHPSEPNYQLEDREKGTNKDGEKMYTNLGQLEKLLECFDDYKIKSLLREPDVTYGSTVGISIEVKDRLVYIPKCVVGDEEKDKLDALLGSDDITKKNHIQEKDFFVEIDQRSSLDIYNTRQNAVMQFVNNVYRMFSLHIKDVDRSGDKVEENMIDMLRSFFSTFVSIKPVNYNYKKDINEFEGMVDGSKLVMTMKMAKKMILNIKMRIENSGYSFFDFPFVPKMMYRNTKKLFRESDDHIVMVGNDVFKYWLSNRGVEFQNTIYDTFTDDNVQFIYLKNADGIEKKYIARKYKFGRIVERKFVGIKKKIVGGGYYDSDPDVDLDDTETRKEAESRVLNQILLFISTYFRKVSSNNVSVNKFRLDTKSKKMVLVRAGVGVDKSRGIYNSIDILYYVGDDGYFNAYWLDMI